MTTATSRTRRGAAADPDRGQRGAAMLLVASLLVALLAGGGVALYVQLQSTKGAGLVKASRASLYCAEAGLSFARSIISLNYLTWSLALDSLPTNDPAWYPIAVDIDGDAVNDVVVTIRDNEDELPPAVNNPARDNDRQVFAVSRCTKHTAASPEIVELLLVAGGGHAYRDQGGGGAFNAGNQNQEP